MPQSDSSITRERQGLPSSGQPGRAPATSAGADAARAAAGPAVRGVIFEMANVLYDATLCRRELLRLLGRHGVRASYRSFFRRWEHRFLGDVNRGYRQYEEALHAFLLSIGLSWGQIDEVEAASCMRGQELEAPARALPGVATSLQQLADADLTLAVLADAPHPGEQLSERLDELGLGGRFSSVLSSLDLETTKPAAACYQAALDALQISAAEAVFVGCDRRSLHGAAAVGLRTIAFNHAAPVRADARVNRFTELVDIIRGWSLSAVGC